MKLVKMWGKDFMSFPDIEIEFTDLSGVVQITGYNFDDKSASGSGKTAVFDLLPFTLFEESPRNLSVSEFIKDGESKTETGVKFLLNNGDFLTIIRLRNKSKPDLYYFYNDDTPKRGDSVTKTQKDIEEILKLDFNTFQNSIYFSRSSSSKFITAEPPEKMKILTRILDLSDFDKAYILASEQESQTQALIDSKSLQWEQAMRDNLVLKQKLTMFQTNSDNFANDKQQDIDNLKSEAEEITKLYASLADQINNLKNKDYLAPKVEDIEKPDTHHIDIMIEEIKEIVYEEVGNFNKPLPDITELQSHITLLTLKVATKQKLETAYNTLNNVRNVLNGELAAANKAINKFNDLTEGNCTQCGNLITEEHKQQEISSLQEEIKEIEFKLMALNKDCKRFEDGLQIIHKIQFEEIPKINYQINSIQVGYENEERDWKEKKLKIESVKVNNSQLLLQLERQKQATYKDYELKVQNIIRLGLDLERQKNLDQQKTIMLREQQESHKKSVKKIGADIANIKAKKNEWSPFIEDYTKQVTDKQLEVDSLVVELKELRATNEALNVLKTSYKNIKYYIFESTIAELNNRISKYLDPLFDEDVKLEFDFESGKNSAKLKFVTNISKNGVEYSYNKLSDGEKTRCELACNFAMSDIVALRKGTGLNLMLLDECFDGTDDTIKERIVSLLEVLKADKETIMVIDHSGAIANLVERKIHVEKRNKSSELVAA